MGTYARQDIVFVRGEGSLADRRERRALSRFRVRRRRQRPRACASATRRGAKGAGRKALAHVEPLPRRGPGDGRRQADAADVCRARLLLQFGRGSLRGRDQGRAPLSLCIGRAGAAADHYFPRRVSWPDAGDARGRRQRTISRRLRAGRPKASIIVDLDDFDALEGAIGA